VNEQERRSAAHAADVNANAPERLGVELDVIDARPLVGVGTVWALGEVLEASLLERRMSHRAEAYVDPVWS
jgi:hypothetical protein